MKTCSKCGEEKPLDEFYIVNRRGTSRPNAQCKSCVQKRTSIWRNANKEYHSNYRKQYYKDHRKELLEYGAQYQKDNRDKIREVNYKWRNANKDKVNAYYKKSRASDPDGDIRDLLKKKNVPVEYITPDLIATQRALIKLKRAIKETKK